MSEAAGHINYLVRGGKSDPLLPRLLRSIRNAEEIELAVAFIKYSGLSLIFDALAEHCEKNSPACLRILTSDYLGITDPQALRKLMLLRERGADVRVYTTDKRSFHLKAYIFIRANGTAGEAFIGSSNISHEALTTGLEWNYRVEQNSANETNRQRLAEIRQAFGELFEAANSRILEHPWIDAYAQRRPEIRPKTMESGDDDPEPLPPEPNPLQQEALAALSATRQAGYRRGLVVMATGLGKTFLAAFDADQSEAERVLFIAHREEILLQAEATFQRVFPTAHVGRYRAEQRDTESRMLFASIQTLHREQHLTRFTPDHFDYIVVDEFHHAAAYSYRRVLQYFRPRFLLGLTATPERADQSEILSLCDDNLVFNRDLFNGIRAERLCPFHYYGIHDESVEYTSIPWRNGSFDEKSLVNSLATRARARHNLREWDTKAGSRTLAFCASKLHAEFMARQFNRSGIPALAVHSTSTTTRNEAIERLGKGKIKVICAVDLFNEGVDIPAIDTVMMLRPTESPVLFLQQLGRGLRRHPDKEHLIVLDFIGNHRAFLNRPQALFHTGSAHHNLQRFAKQAQQQSLELPDGCFVNFDIEFIDFIKRLKPHSAADEYRSLAASAGRRPSVAEAYRAGIQLNNLRKGVGSWHRFLLAEDQLTEAEAACVTHHGDFLQEIEKTNMTKSYKMVLLEALLELDGFRRSVPLPELAEKSLEVFQRQRELVVDLPTQMRDVETLDPGELLPYWKSNPINAWTGGNQKSSAVTWFQVREGRFEITFNLNGIAPDTLAALVQEVVDFKLAAYKDRLADQTEQSSTATTDGTKGDVLPFADTAKLTDTTDNSRTTGDSPLPQDAPSLEDSPPVEIVPSQEDVFNPFVETPWHHSRHQKLHKGEAKTPRGVISGYLPDGNGQTGHAASESESAADHGPAQQRIQLPYFPDLKIACGYFRTGNADIIEHVELPAGYGRVDPRRHFIAPAHGNSMNGGKTPIRNGDHLLLEFVTNTSAGSITGSIMAIERQDETGDSQYLLRVVTKDTEGQYVLRANNPAYEDLIADNTMRTFARLRAVMCEL